ncbi:MAG: sensor signal transduction histidine kinase [Labilithrix sp.]|nr:sensor signal transduction histidine kinase [Labilithrix sp.]
MAEERQALRVSLEEARSALARAEVSLEERSMVLDLRAALDRAIAEVSGQKPLSAHPPPRSAEEERLSRVDAEAAQRRLAFAHEASRVLFDSPLDARLRLQSLARIAVPDLADWCFCDLLDTSGVERVAAENWNPVHAAVAAQLLGRFVPPGGSPTARVLETGETLFEPDAFPVALGPGSGAPVARSLMAVPLRTRGKALGVVTFAFSESNRRYGETDRALAEDLAQRAAIAVENAFLVSDLERSISARDELVGIVSHDLRTPLSTVRMAASLLRDDLDETVHKGTARVAMIMRATTRMEALVRDLLDVTALEGGGFTLDVGAQDAAPLVADALELFHANATQRGVTLLSTVGGGIEIRADRERVIQVLSNLIGNALKFTPKGGSITVSAERTPGGFATFSVKDTGSGIAAAELQHVFDRFYQGKRKAREGAGLGLSIVRGIVKAHGGEVGVTSEPGAGTTFFFSLPLA